jgi:hypothetical protein
MGRGDVRTTPRACALLVALVSCGCGGRMAGGGAPTLEGDGEQDATADAEPDSRVEETGAAARDATGDSAPRDEGVDTPASPTFDVEWVITTHARSSTDLGGTRTVNGVYVDGAGNTWVSCHTLGTSDWNEAPSKDLFVTKLDPSGKRVWTISTAARLLAVTVDGRGLLAGNQTGETDWGSGSKETEVLFAELDGDGAVARKVRWVGEPGAIIVTAMSVTSDDRLFVTGLFTAEADLGGIATPADTKGGFLAVFDGARKLERLTTWRGPAAWRLVASSSGAAYAGGGATGVVDFGGGPITAGAPAASKSPIYYSPFLVGFDAEGKHRWSTLVPGAFTTGDYGAVDALGIDPRGGVVVGTYGALTRYDDDGIQRWSIAEALPHLRDDLVVGTDGTIFSIATVSSSRPSGWDARLERYDPSGSLVSSRALGTLQLTHPSRRMAIDPRGRIHIAALFFADLSIGAPPPSAAESFGDVFVAQLKP